MTTISRYLEAEVVDPSLPRDAFVPPTNDNDDFNGVDDLPIDLPVGDDDE
jgi:hypothetical protein